MPLSFYSFHEENSLIVTTIVGRLDGRELTDLFREQTADPRAPKLTRHLVDLRLAEGSGPSMEVIRSLAWSSRAFLMRHACKSHRTALVAVRDIDFGYARMFASFAEWLPCQVSVFRTMREACEWLEIDDEFETGARSAEAATEAQGAPSCDDGEALGAVNFAG